MKPAAPSLRFLFIVTVSLLTLFITVSITYLISKQYKIEAMNHLMHYTETVAQDMALASTDYILTENFSSLQDLTLSYSDRTHIQAMAVLNRYRVILASSQLEQLGQVVDLKVPDTVDGAYSGFDVDTWIMHYLLPIRIAGTTVGWCRVQVNTKHLQDDLAALQQKVIYLGIAIWLLVCVISFFLSSFMSRSIAAVIHVAREVSAANFNEQVAVQGPQEVRELAVAFNAMTDAIANRQRLLEASEEKFRSLAEEINDWVWEFDANGIRTYISPSVEKTLGYSADELLGKSVFDSLPEEMAKQSRKVFAGYIEKRSSFKAISHAQYHKNGQLVMIETSGQPVFDENGVLQGYRGVARDITQRKQAEEALQAEKERLSVTLRSIGDGVITTDIQGKIVFLNRVAEQLTGWTNKEAEGRMSSEVFNIINEKTQKVCADPVRQVLNFETITGLERHTALIAKDGTVRTIADSSAPIRDKESHIVGVVLVFRDVTHEKKTEEELLKIRKLESVGVLAGGIAHDFNNILSAILGNIELAGYRVAEEDSKTAALLADAGKATRRAAKLTDQLLTFSKGGEPVKEKTSLPKLITDSADFVLRGSKVACTYDFSEQLWMVDVDSGQISQVIQNIIINARHAMAEGGTVVIQCKNVQDAAIEPPLGMVGGKYVRVTIEDSGSGIAKEIIGNVFDPYFTTKSEGSGLGLAISHSIATKHDGYLTVNSPPGKGTIFTLYLPALDSIVENIVEKPKTMAAVPGLRVMVMDDDEMVLTVAEAQLVALGHKAVLVIDGGQAIDRYQELRDSGTPVDLVIMDLTIPGGMGGRDAAARLLQIDPQARLIVASGYSNDPVMAEYEKYGFRAALSKPFDLQELSNAMASVY